MNENVQAVLVRVLLELSKCDDFRHFESEWWGGRRTRRDVDKEKGKECYRGSQKYYIYIKSGHTIPTGIVTNGVTSISAVLEGGREVFSHREILIICM